MRLSNREKTALLIIIEGVAASIVLNLYSPFTQMFAKRLGAGDLHIALINSLPPLVAIAVLIPCSIWIERINNKKLVTCFLIAVNSIFYAVIAFVPVLPNEIRLISYIMLIGLMNWPGSLYTTTWQSFFSYIFSGSEAARVYSLRSKYSAFFGLLAALVAGYILSSIPHNENERVVIYQCFYFACFLISIFQVLSLSRVREANNSYSESVISNMAFGWKDFKSIFSNKPFIIYTLCVFIFHVSWQMGWPLFFLYHVDIVKANEFQLSMIIVVQGLASFLSFSMWNRLVDKKGSSFAIVFGALGLATNPFLYLTTNNIIPILLINVFIGIAASGFSYTLFCNLLDILPEDKRTVYISFFNTFINISGFVSPLIGIWIYSLTGIVKVFMIIGSLRTIAVLIFIWRWYNQKKANRQLNENGECSKCVNL